MNETPPDEPDYEEDAFETAMDECGEVPGNGCMLAGTEHCEFEYPFRDSMYREMSKNRDSKGRYCK